MQGQPEGSGVRAILAAPLTLEGWTGKGATLPVKPRRSRADDGQRKPGWGACDPPGRSAGRWRTGPWATSGEAASCGGRMPPHLRQDGSCPDGPGHGVASGPGYCRGPVAERRGTMVPYSGAMARAGHRCRVSRQGGGLLAAPLSSGGLEAATRGACSGPGWAGLSHGCEGPATGAGPEAPRFCPPPQRRQLGAAASPPQRPCVPLLSSEAATTTANARDRAGQHQGDREATSNL